MKSLIWRYKTMNEDFFEIYESIVKMDNLEEKITKLKKDKNKVHHK